MNDKFVKCLNKHEIFKNLSESLSEREKTKCLRLITCQKDFLYVWNSSNQCVDSVSINTVLKEEDSDYVKLVPTPSVCFDVEQISVNRTSTCLLLSGPKGAAFINLPDRWMLKEKRIDLNASSLAQRVFLIEHCVLRQIRWHPYSFADSHLLMLTSDEKMRLYSCVDSCLMWECSLTNHTIRRNLPGKLSLGETPVDFDFGLCEDIDSGDVTYPVYIVWGNGDVYSVQTRIEDCRGKLQGPFRVSPAADDNYGSDASSIVVMETSPPFIAIATNSGLLYHCLVLPEDSKRDAKVIHVVERVELELGLSLGVDTADDIVTCSISLERDPNLDCRYFCFHNAGVHSVLLPIVAKLNSFCLGSRLKMDNIQSYTEYLLCTAITTGSGISCSPTLGIAFLDLTKVLILLSEGKLLQVQLLSQSDQPLPEIQSEAETPKAEDNFHSLIDNLLKEGGVSSCPLMKLPGSSTNPKEWLEIVLKATQSYRAVLKSHTDVALKIQQKSHQLKATLKRQVGEMNDLNDKKSSLRSTAEQIAEKYEEINEKQSELVKRMQRLLLKVGCDDNSVSANEKKMASILEKAKAKLAVLETDVKVVQSYCNQLENTKLPEEKDIYIGNKIQMLYKSLKHLTDEVNDATNRIKTANETVKMLQYQE